MLFTTNKPLDEILESMEGEKNVFLLACNGCAEACGTGGQKALDAIKGDLEKAGKAITGSCVVDFLCNKVLVAARLSQVIDRIRQADSILVLTCGIGVQAVSRVVAKPVHPADNTVSLGGLQGLWPSDERCAACGDCALDYTGGICPVTSCAKGLLNGPCGGPRDKMCEVDQEKECGWLKIYDRLKALGRLENLRKLYKARDHGKVLVSRQVRDTTAYDVEK
jgi:hypothetical protein